MEPNNQFTIHNGDNLPLLKQLADNSIDAIVTDPPYGLSFMGKKWDYDVPSEDVWRECLRVLKPGGHLLAFAGTRTQHRMAVRIEDAGFEIRDMIAWVYGSGFNKIGYIRDKNGNQVREGWGGSIKPALEPITLARKPLSGTVAANVLTHGTGALNVDGCRVGTEVLPQQKAGQSQVGTFERRDMVTPQRTGRWPANFIHDGSDEVVGLFPVQPSGKSDGRMVSAARFFYCAKASKRDRDEGCEGMEERRHQSGMGGAMPIDDNGKERDRFTAVSRNHHPTVKPTALMRYLCRLVTPPGGIVLDPFMGSGSTGCAAILEGFRFIGMEREPEYVVIAQARIEHAIERAIEQDSASACNSSQLSLLETLDES